MINWVFGWISIEYLIEKGVISKEVVDSSRG